MPVLRRMRWRVGGVSDVDQEYRLTAVQVEANIMPSMGKPDTAVHVGRCWLRVSRWWSGNAKRGWGNEWRSIWKKMRKG